MDLGFRKYRVSPKNSLLRLVVEVRSIVRGYYPTKMLVILKIDFGDLISVKHTAFCSLNPNVFEMNKIS